MVKTDHFREKRVIICGAGDVGTYIMSVLAENDYNVILIDHDEDKIEAAKKIADIAVHVGHCCNINIYKDLNVNENDIVVAVTSSDEVNLTICNMLKNFGCSTTIARVRQSFYKEQLQLNQKDYFKNKTVI